MTPCRLVVLLILTALVPSSAYASCSPDVLKLLWSYPEAGAKDVPTNATFWALTTLAGLQPKAVLNGAPVDVEMHGFSAFSLKPDSLQPGTDYVLVLDYSGMTPIQIAFRTSTEAAPVASRPAVTGHTLSQELIDAHACPDVIWAQDCFDTGQNTLLSFVVEADNQTLGWTIGNGVVWPARCGDPGIYKHWPDMASPPACYSIRRIGAGGQLSEATEHCPVGGTPVLPVPDAGAAPSGDDAGPETPDAAISPLPVGTPPPVVPPPSPMSLSKPTTTTTPASAGTASAIEPTPSSAAGALAPAPAPAPAQHARSCAAISGSGGACATWITALLCASLCFRQRNRRRT